MLPDGDLKPSDCSFATGFATVADRQQSIQVDCPNHRKEAGEMRREARHPGRAESANPGFRERCRKWPGIAVADGVASLAYGPDQFVVSSPNSISRTQRSDPLSQGWLKPIRC
jgi:hypothetical protein